MRKLFFIPLLLVLCACTAQQFNYVQYVDPMVGTGGHGHTFPGATVPFGMVQLSPDTRIDGSWDGCSGYHYSDSIVYGFSHTHLSGTGCSDYGDILLFPTSEEITSTDFPHHTYSSSFKHKNEKASAGYYSVKLDNGVNVELTATTRVGFHKYTFTNKAAPWIILDLSHRDKTLEASFKEVSNTEIEGMRRSEAWAKDQHIYFVAKFSEPFVESKNLETGGLNIINRHAFKFSNQSKSIYVKVGISTVSIEGARKNLEAELPEWDFEKTKQVAEEMWNKELGKIEVVSSDIEKMKIFYTALYHTLIQPNVAMDVDGMYRGRDNKIHQAEGFTYYSVFSLWDTFRAAHPLYTLIDQKRTSDYINTFLAQYEQGGRLPVWELASNETDCMIGYHSVSVIADAMVKGIKGFDYEKAFEASKHSAMLDHLGLKAYKQNGFISMDDEPESVSKTLEYAYDDWCIAQMAKVLNKNSDYDYFMKRSQSWKNLFDQKTGFMRPKKNGGWLEPFEPREVNNNFTEGNSWQYTFFVPQDVTGLIAMMGGNDMFEKKLDELFTTSSQTTGREQADISGLVGQYAHGNEPSHHMAYLYNFVNKPQKTQYRIHQIMNEFYKAAPDGLIGNEDCGQMSAWYVLNAIGLYSVIPGGGNFEFGTPVFNHVKIHLENAKIFEIDASDLSNTHFYVQKYVLNGVPVRRLSASYQSLMLGGVLSLKMSGTPSGDVSDTTFSSPIKSADLILPVPTINAKSRVFDDSLLITLSAGSSKDNIVYSCSDSATQPLEFVPYRKSFTIQKSKTVVAYIDNKNMKSDTVSGSFYKRPNHWVIKINSNYNPQYTAGGDEGIIDGLRGDVNWRKGEWQGYQSQDFEAIVDFGKKIPVHFFSAGFLQDSRSWILMPVKVEYYTSSDNVNYTLVETVENTVKPDDYITQIKEFAATHSKPINARYVKVKAYNFGKLPEWHQGAGGDAFLFVDEINVR